MDLIDHRPNQSHRADVASGRDSGGGRHNLGVHVWHCLTNMSSRPLEPPESAGYGLGPAQRDNMAQSFVAHLSRDVASIVQDIMQEGAAALGESGSDGEGDESGLMQRFLGDGSGGVGDDPRTNVTAQVLLNRMVNDLGWSWADRKELLGIVRERNGHLHQGWAGGSGQEAGGLRPRLRGAMISRPQQGELLLAQELEEDSQRHGAEQVAQMEYEALRTARRQRRPPRHRRARQYCEWEEWEFQNAMGIATHCPDEVQLTVRGRVEQGVPQSMELTMTPGQTLCLKLTMERPDPKRRKKNVTSQTEEGGLQKPGGDATMATARTRTQDQGSAL